MQDILLSRQRVRTQKAKETISGRHELAGLIGMYVYKMLDSDVSIPAKWDMYPELFTEEKKLFETERIKRDLEEARISRREYARAYNRQRNMQGVQK